MHSLRRQLIISHILPLLISIPLLGLALIYVLETQFVRVNLIAEMREESELMADLLQTQGGVWSDPAQAQTFVDSVKLHVAERVMLLGPDGRLLASSNVNEQSRVGQVANTPGLSEALAGEVSTRTDYNPERQAAEADVLLPVLASDQHLVGVVRLSSRLDGVTTQFARLQYLIVALLAAALLLGVLAGSVIALNFEQSLGQVTQAISQFSQSQQPTPVAVEGPEEIARLASAFNTLLERLRTLEDGQRRLLANLVHELGRPLGAFQSAIQALLRGADQDEALRRELLLGMEQEVGHLARLLDDLAGLHDHVVGGLHLDYHPLALSDWLPPAVVTWRAAATAKGLHWQASIPSDLPLVEVDADRLDQALGNLLSNAIKYTPPGGTVALAAGAQDDQVWLRVSDTGPGIASEEQSKIFTPFYRGPTNTRLPEGMGVGLAIARDLAVAHGGRLEVESRRGEGSQFTLWLPLSR